MSPDWAGAVGRASLAAQPICLQIDVFELGVRQILGAVDCLRDGSVDVLLDQCLGGQVLRWCKLAGGDEGLWQTSGFAGQLAVQFVCEVLKAYILRLPILAHYAPGCCEAEDRLDARRDVPGQHRQGARRADGAQCTVAQALTFDFVEDMSWEIASLEGCHVQVSVVQGK